MSENTSTVTRVYRTHIGEHFLMVSNQMCRGQEPIQLSALAFRVLLYLLSLPQGWEMSRKQLNEAFPEGRDQITNAIKELKAKGYLVQTRGRSTSGAWEWTWEVTDDPINHPLNDRLRDSSAWSEQGKQGSVQVAPSTEIPSTENQSILEDGLKNTDPEYGSVGGRDERKGEEPLPAGVAVATSAGAHAEGARLARPTPAEELEARLQQWRESGKLCESGQHERTPFCKWRCR